MPLRPSRAQSGGLLLAAAPLAAEVGRELAALVSEPALSEQLSQEFGAADSDPQDLADRLEQAARAAAADAHARGAQAAAGVLPDALPGLLLLLERLGGLMVEYGAPAR